jgi:hypothetical protein
VRYAIVAANDHYAGFAPGTVDIFRQMLNLDEVKWEHEYVSTDALGEEGDAVRINESLRPNRQIILSLSSEKFPPCRNVFVLNHLPVS